MNSNEVTVFEKVSLTTAKQAYQLVRALRDPVPTIIVTRPRELLPKSKETKADNTCWGSARPWAWVDSRRRGLLAAMCRKGRVLVKDGEKTQ